MIQTTTSAGIAQNPVLAAVKSWWSKLFAKKQKPYVESEYSKELRKTFDTLKFWTPELIEWIGNENDPVKLSCACHLVNCHEWPEWLPSKPEKYNDYIKNDEYFLRIHFACELMRMLEKKADAISPGLCQKIWLTNYFRGLPVNGG